MAPERYRMTYAQHRTRARGDCECRPECGRCLLARERTYSVRSTVQRLRSTQLRVFRSRRFIKKREGAPMPKLYPAPLSDQDIADVSAFVETLKWLVESPSNDGAGLLTSREVAPQPRPAGALRCGGRLKIIAAIVDPAMITKILTHLHLPARAPPRSPARRVDHLKWAFSELATTFLRANPRAQALHERLKARHGKGKALAIIAAKLAGSHTRHRQVPGVGKLRDRHSLILEVADRADTLRSEQFVATKMHAGEHRNWISGI